jgi:hypothetical protein
MTIEEITVDVGYAADRLRRAMETLTAHPDATVRGRASAKIDAWTAVIAGMSAGSLSIGSRTPVANTPAWVTLEVLHGGFASGRYLAEGPMLPHEQEVLARLSAGPSDEGSTARARINAYYLGDEGHRALTTALRERRYSIDLPEEGALLIAAWLFDRGRVEQALDLVAEISPLFSRLRFYPRLEATPRPAGASVRLKTAGEIADSLRDRGAHPRVATEKEALSVWASLFDRLVALWLSTVEGEAPRLNEGVVVGGWPCRIWPASWEAERRAWLADYRAAAATHARAHKHVNRKSNFARLAGALELCARDSSRLRARDVGWIRRALANTVTKHGTPGSLQRDRLRGLQAIDAARPYHADIARVLAARLDAYPKDGGLPSLEVAERAVANGENARVLGDTEIPAHFVKKLERALEAPIEELIARKVIASAEVLALVLPQLTAQIVAAGIEDAELRDLYAQIYAAFRRRRSLLLLNLEHQVRLEELPWIAAIWGERSNRLSATTAARQTLEQAVLLSLCSFPQTILPNPLVRELGALSERAGLLLPLVEEIAADIFMGTFTMKWPMAARVASAQLGDSLYGRYYELPNAAEYRDFASEPKVKWRWQRETADGFALLCRQRAEGAGATGGRSVAFNGAVLEQSQILTTQNLALLVAELGLTDRVRSLAPSLAERVFVWIERRQTQKIDEYRGKLQMVKNTAYAWRQAIYLLSLCDVHVQETAIRALETRLSANPEWVAFRPVVAGLRAAFEGARFDDGGTVEGGRRFLGWSTGGHWLLARTS